MSSRIIRSTRGGPGVGAGFCAKICENAEINVKAKRNRRDFFIRKYLRIFFRKRFD
jgi:hypothetical protein